MNSLFKTASSHQQRILSLDILLFFKIRGKARAQDLDISTKRRLFRVSSKRKIALRSSEAEDAAAHLVGSFGKLLESFDYFCR